MSGFLKTLGAVVPYILSTVFLTAAVLKIWDIGAFSWYVTTITFLPARIRDLLTFIVPLGEICIGCMLLLPSLRKTSLIACLVVLVIFTGFLFAMVMNPAAPYCRCFGTILLSQQAHMENKIALARDLVLLTLTAFAIYANRRSNINSLSETHQVSL